MNLRVYFIVSTTWGSTSMSGHQISQQLVKNNIQASVVNIKEYGYERLKEIKESIVIFIKFIDSTALGIFREKNNIIIWHVVDEMCFNADMRMSKIVDGVIVPNKHTEMEYKEKFKNTQFRAIYEHGDPRWQFNDAKEYKLVYLGSKFSKNITNAYLSIKDLNLEFINAKIDGEQYDLFKIALNYNCHFSVRKEDSITFKYKPCTKIASAAATNSNIILSKDYSNIELLDASYPYYTTSNLRSVKETVAYSKETYGTSVWNKGLGMMAEVREKTSVEVAAKNYIEFFKRFSPIRYSLKDRKSMNICFVLSEFITKESFVGGVAKTFYRFAKHLALCGHEVHVIMHAGCTEDIKDEGMFIHKLSLKTPLWVNAINKLTFGKVRGSIYWLLFSWEASKLVKRLDKEKKIDIIHSCNYHYTGLFSLILTKIPHIVQAVSFRPAWNNAIGMRKTSEIKMMEFVESLYLRASRNVCASSKCMRDMLFKWLRLKNVKFIPYTFYTEVELLDYSLYKSKIEGKTYLLFFGQNKLHKGIHVLAQALPKVFKEFPNIYVVFVGDDESTTLGPSMHEYIRAQNRPFADRLVFTGACPAAQLYPIIQNAKIVVLPSLVDSLPNALLDSIGQGKPVIGTIGCSFDEVIEDGVNGFLVPMGDVEALGKKICEALSRTDLEKIGMAAKEKMKEFAPEKTVAALVNYYKEVIQKKV